MADTSLVEYVPLSVVFQDHPLNSLFKNHGARVRLVDKKWIVSNDLAMVVSGKNMNDAGKDAGRIDNDLFPETNYVIKSLPGKGNSKCKMIGIDNAIKFVMALPGKTATLFRSKLADGIILRVTDAPAAAGSSSQAVINAFPCHPNGEYDLHEGVMAQWETSLNKREAKLTEQKTKQDHREAKLTEQKTKQDHREAKLIEQKTEQDHQEAKLTEQKDAFDQWEAKLIEQKAVFDQRKAKLIEQKTEQDQRKAKLIEQKTEQDQREARLIEQKTEQDQREAKLIEQKAELDHREAEMGLPRVVPDDNALQTKKRNRETDLEFLVKAANSIFESKWADDEMKQDIKTKIKKLTNSE